MFVPLNPRRTTVLHMSTFPLTGAFLRRILTLLRHLGVHHVRDDVVVPGRVRGPQLLDNLRGVATLGRARAQPQQHRQHHHCWWRRQRRRGSRRRCRRHLPFFRFPSPPLCPPGLPGLPNYQIIYGISDIKLAIKIDGKPPIVVDKNQPKICLSISDLVKGYTFLANFPVLHF